MIKNKNVKSLGLDNIVYINFTRVLIDEFNVNYFFEGERMKKGHMKDT